MASFYVPLAAPNVGRGIDFSPVNNALANVTQQNNRNALLDLQTRQADQSDKRLAIEQGQFDIQKQNAQQALVSNFGKRATAVDQAFPPGDPRRAAAWSQTVEQHNRMFPGQTLTPEELDPVTGPKLMAAQAGQFVDPRDSQAKDLGLRKTQAEIDALEAKAANGGTDLGKLSGIFLNPETGRYEAVQFGARGQAKHTDLGGLTPARGVTVAGDEVIDRGTGGAVRNIGPNLSQGELAKGLGSEGAKYIMGKPREDAIAAVSTVQNMDEAKRLLDEGVITGKGANLITSMKGWADTFGIAGKDDQELLKNTQAFAAEMGREVGNVIRAFGSGTGLSDADREYAQAIAGGNIELTKDALRKITDINRRLAIAKINSYNKMVSRVEKGLSPFPLEVEIPSGEVPAQGNGTDWRSTFKRVE